MKCTNKVISILLITAVLGTTLLGCGKEEYEFPYSRNMVSSAYMITDSTIRHDTLNAFSENLCVDERESVPNSAVSVSSAYASGLFDLNKGEVLYADNMYEELPPASLTKVMTALVALKYGNLEDEIHVSGNCKITESGAQLFKIKEGDIMTLDQALNILLLFSANDVALAIAEHVGGTQENFIKMMNDEAISLGATHTNFMNPHGLTQEDHYTTVYDLYLIFNEVVKYERFREIIQLTSYTSTYHDKNMNEKEIKIKSTNQYLVGNVTAPTPVTVLGGKTGTTNAAGNCLILYSKDKSGNPFISVILRAETRDLLYEDMNKLLEAVQ